MSDIPPPSGIIGVQRREERPHQDAEQKQHEPPANKVAEVYEESARAIDDKITILGIPVDLMTTQVRATIGGLVSEVEHLKSKVKRYESSIENSDSGVPDALLMGDNFVKALDRVLASVPLQGQNRQLALIDVNTFEDIRKSSGLLAANSVLADVIAEIQGSPLEAAPIGLIGGPSIAALLTEPDDLIGQLDNKDADTILSVADKVRVIVEDAAYSVSGLDMKLSFTVASVRVETGQDALQAIGQADHVLRS
ncbi:MAG: diguanylate cyclase [Alphaproteobacteria bacterium]|nr:diguanylate cyclase [Alphaproteobacteria bacterium]